MKLAGLTWWRNNYGSILQAYALQCTLNEVEEIDYEIICQFGKKIASLDNLVDKIKTVGLRKTIKRVIWRFGLPRLRERNHRIQNFVDKNLRISDRQYNEDTIAESNKYYDGFICGSDQIWNPELSPLSSMYWLNFANESKVKCSYAPSIGVSEVTDQQAEIIRENLKGFSAISCRESSGTQLLNSIMKKDVCVTVLDPTLLINRKRWDILCKPRKFQQPYIFTYILRGNKKQRQLIEDFAAKKGLSIVTIPFLESEHIEMYDFKFGDHKLWDAAPDDFLTAIRYADYVFTDSYHCMIFSCLYHREFFTFPKVGGKAQMSRITGLQNMLQISGRMINEHTPVWKLTEVEKINWNVVEKQLSEKQIVSRKYFNDMVDKMRRESCDGSIRL